MKIKFAIVSACECGCFQTNKYYSSHEEYVGALATQLETEYRKGDEIRSPNHCELELPKRQLDHNTAPRALNPQLTSLILYSCKSKLDCWSLFCSLARTVIGSH